MAGCKRCGVEHCNPLKRNDATGTIAYWFATLKDSDDFLILMSSLQMKYITFNAPNYPGEKLTDKYDFYCTDCYLHIMSEKGISATEWKR